MKDKIKVLIIIIFVILLICIVMILKLKKDDNESQYISEIAPPEEKYTKIKEKYECNEFEYINVTTDDLIKTYFNKYKEEIIEDVDKSYEMLDSDYRQKRFANIEEYKKYINENYEQIIGVNLNSYKIDTSNEGYVQYICLDENNNYYIFREFATMQYNILLDNYTLDLPEFIEKYNSTNEQGKVALNIQKFMQSLNAKDYNYAYNCLSEGFRKNYFNSVENFEKYINEEFPSNSETQYIQFEKVGELYNYKINITDAVNKGNIIEKTIIMKLNDETDFEMSFNVN